ncbi:hypothetical protein PFUM301597_15990 [Pseudomonas fluorescens]
MRTGVIFIQSPPRAENSFYSLWPVYNNYQSTLFTTLGIAWVLLDSAVCGAIVGARRPNQVDGLIAAISVRLSEAEIEEISRYLPEGMGTNVPTSVA